MKDEDLFDKAKDEPGFPKSIKGERAESSLTGADPLKRIGIYPTSLVRYSLRYYSKLRQRTKLEAVSELRTGEGKFLRGSVIGKWRMR